jgi:hypothetical protein
MSTAEKKVDDVGSAIIVLFDHIRDTASQYWSIRDQIMECKFDRAFNEYAYQQDRHHSGRQEAWEDFGTKWVSLELELEKLKREYGSVEVAFLEKKRALLVDTDAILNTAFQLLREISCAKSVSEISFGGRPVYGIPPAFQAIETSNEIPSVPVKNLIWYGRHQANHFYDIPVLFTTYLKG